MKQKVNILNVEFENKTKAEVTNLLIHRIDTNHKTFIVTANPEIVMFAQRHPDYKQALDKADFIVPDGIGVILAAKLIKQPLQERIAGFDLMYELLAIANQKAWNVYFLGAKKEVIERAVQNISKTFPNLSVSGYHHGYFDLNDETIAQKVNASQPDLVFVALGYPKQEIWIQKNISSFEKGLFMGVGGSFDVWAGEVKRAPLFWRKLNLEWLYRLIKQPSRWRRMLVLPQFIIKVIKKRA